MAITPQQARIELARRELARREQEQQANDPYNRMGTEDEGLELARNQISQKFPGMPAAFRDALLSITPRNESPMLGSAARGFSDVTNYIPAAFGGALQGASLPIRGVAGLIPTELTQGLANSPDLTGLFPKAQGFGQETAQMAGEFAGGGGLLGKMFQGAQSLSAASKIPKALQNPTALAATGAVSTPGDIENRGMAALGGAALGGAGQLAYKGGEKLAEKVPAFFRGLTTKSTPEELILSVQKPHDLLEKTADELYGQVRHLMGERNVKVNINPSILDEILEYPSMHSKTHRELVQKAKDGDYEALHTLQSSLYRKGSKDVAHGDSVIETRGENLLDLRKRINKELERDLLKQGHTDIAHVLRQGKEVYKKLQDTYYHKDLPKNIGKLVHPDLRLTPENPEKLFQQNSVPMSRFLEQHPDAAKHVKEIKEKQEAIKQLNSLLLKGAVASGLGISSKNVYDWLK